MSRKNKRRSKLLEAIMLGLVGVTMVGWVTGIKKNTQTEPGTNDTKVQSTQESTQESTIATGPEETEKREKPWGIKVNGKLYEYSALYGITDFQEIEGKVYVVTGGVEADVYEVGAATKEDSDAEPSDLTAFMVNPANTNISKEYSLGKRIFEFNKNYETDDGIVPESTFEDVVNKGYRKIGENQVVCYEDENGPVSWEEVDALVNQMVEEDSFICIKHLDEPFSIYMWDVLKMDYYQDNVEGFITTLGEKTNSDGKEILSSMVARALVEQRLLDSEIDFYIEKSVNSYLAEKSENLPMDITVVSYKANVEFWGEHWGVNIP